MVRESDERAVGVGAGGASAGTGPCVAVAVAGGGTFGAGEGMVGAGTGVRCELRAAARKGITREFLRGMGECTVALATLSSGRKADGETPSFVIGVDATFSAAAGVTDAGLLPAYSAGQGFSHRPMSRAAKTHPVAITQGSRLPLSLFCGSSGESKSLSTSCKGSTETSCLLLRAGWNGSIEGLAMTSAVPRTGARFLLSESVSREWRASIRKRSRQ